MSAGRPPRLRTLWESEGATGWGWDDVRPYFLKSEDNERGASEAPRGPAGCLRVEDEALAAAADQDVPWAAAEAAGIPYIDDYNGPEQDGAALCQVTQLRRGGAGARARRVPGNLRSHGPNVEVVTGADGARASSSRVTARFRPSASAAAAASASSAAEREVILSAGPRSNSPPAAPALGDRRPGPTWPKSRSPCATSLPGVGPQPPGPPRSWSAIWDVPGGGSLADAEKPKAMLEWLTAADRSVDLHRRRGLSRSWRHAPGALPAPDVQFHFAPGVLRGPRRPAEYDGHAITARTGADQPQGRRGARVGCARGDPGRQAADPHELAGPSRTNLDSAGGRACGWAREIAATEPIALDRPARSSSPGRRRDLARGCRGRRAAPGRAALPPGRHLPDRPGRGWRSSIRSCALRRASRGCAWSTRPSSR